MARLHASALVLNLFALSFWFQMGTDVPLLFLMACINAAAAGHEVSMLLHHARLWVIR
jgi:hypothetical protein